MYWELIGPYIVQAKSVGVESNLSFEVVDKCSADSECGCYSSFSFVIVIMLQYNYICYYS